MNIQARNLTNRKNRARGEAGRSILMRLWVLLNVIVIISAAFLIINYKIALNQDISVTEREIGKVKSELHQLDREMEALRIRRENLSSWEYIRVRIAYYNLPLRQPTPDQTRQLVMTPGRYTATETATAENRPRNAGNNRLD